MTWQVFLAISVVFFSLSTVLQKIVLREEKTDPIAFSIIFKLLSGLIIGAFKLFTGGFSFPNWQSLIFNLVAMVIISTVANVAIFLSLKKIEASQFTVIFSTRVLFTIIASSLFLGEGLNPLQMLGTFLVLAGVVIVT